jgi:hypothetical protein
MGQNYSSPPLDALAAFAIAFIAGAMAAISLVKYIERVRHDTIVLRRYDRT